MTSLKTMFYATLGAAVLLPLGINAQMLEEEVEELAPVYASEIELGVGVNTEEDHWFGKFNALEDDGAYLIGNFMFRKPRSAGDNSRDYWELWGTNLGLDNRNIYGEYTQYGLFSVYVDYDERVNNLIDDAQSPYSGLGTTSLTLPSNWQSGQSVSEFFGGDTDALLATMNQFTIEKERQKYGGGVSWDISDLWQLSANYHYEEKDGTDDFGAVFGNSGGNPRAVIVPMPHNFEFNEFDAGVAYKGDRAQFKITYTLSIFENQIRSLLFDNAYEIPVRFGSAQWPAGTAYSDGARGQIGNIFPDNEAWSINLSGGWNWSPRTRLTANVSYGEMTQDEAFLPFTSIAGIGGGLDTLPRPNLDGEIDNTYANVNLTHRFAGTLQGLGVKARFTYDDRDNSTPRDVYVRIAGDAQLQADGTHRYPRPYSFERWKLEFDADYRLPYMSKLSAGYAYEEVERDLQERQNTYEHEFEVKLNTMPAPWVSGWAKYTYSNRFGGDNDIPAYYQQVLDAVSAAGFSVNASAVHLEDYFSNLPFLEGEAPDEVAQWVSDFLASPSSGSFYGFFENDPLVRKYYMANRIRNQFNSNVSFYPAESVIFTVNGNYIDDDYEYSWTGLRGSVRSNLTLDAAYAPTDRFNINAFFTAEKNDYAQRGFERSGGQNATVSIPDRVASYGNNFWQMYTEESVYTTGLAFDWEVIEDKFDLSLDMTYSDATTDIEPAAENYAASTRLPEIVPFPDVETRIYRIKLDGDYKFRDGWGSRVFYWYERYNSTDFALDGTVSWSTDNVLLLGNLPPTYNAHVIGVSVYRKF